MWNCGDKNEEKCVCLRWGLESWLSRRLKPFYQEKHGNSKIPSQKASMLRTNSHYLGNIRFLQCNSLKRHFENGKQDPNVIAILLVP